VSSSGGKLATHKIIIFIFKNNNNDDVQVNFCWLEESLNEFLAAVVVVVLEEEREKRVRLLLSQKNTIEQVQQGVYSAPCDESIIIWSVNCVGFFFYYFSCFATSHSRVVSLTYCVGQ